MRRIIIATCAMLLVGASTAPSAFAWEGGQITSVSCPEIHVRLPVEHGNWQVWAVENGKTVFTTQVPGASYDQVVGGFYMPDAATHKGYVYAANAANLNDGKVSLPYQLTNCAQPIGVPGPPGPGSTTPGPAGPPGASTPGQNTTTSTTTVIQEAPKVCTSKRKYSFKVRKYYTGPDGNPKSQLVVGVKASEPGVKDIVVKKITSGKYAGRFQVSWSTVGQTFKAPATVKTMTVRLSLRDGKVRHVRTVYKYRPCTPKDGNLNDPSATGQGTTGGS